VKQVVVQTLLDAGTLIDTVHNQLPCTLYTVQLKVHDRYDCNIKPEICIH